MASCFVVMGYGVKTDFQQNKSFDLDKTYRNIIKPAVTAANFDCVRADEIQHAGTIDVPMYERLLTAELVIADLSTANVNAFFELGVRYALRPRTTIVIAEKGYKLPFDMSHIVVRHYEHLGTGIDSEEVDRMRAELTASCKAVVAGGAVDSPVYTFVKGLVEPTIRHVAAAAVEVAAAAAAHQAAIAAAGSVAEKVALSKPYAALMEAARTARAANDFDTARDLLRGVRAAQGKSVDPFVVQQLALATYKSGKPDAKTALLEARDVLAALDPEASSDPETLGLWGAIHKRLWELKDQPQRERLAALDKAVWAHEKGFYLKNDYYNGINLAFLLYTRAAEGTGEEAIADRVQARRIATRVRLITQQLLAAGVKGESEADRKAEQYWVQATLAEALLGTGDKPESAFGAFAAAKSIAPEEWMSAATAQQLDKLRTLLETK